MAMQLMKIITDIKSIILVFAPISLLASMITPTATKFDTARDRLPMAVMRLQ